MLLLVLGFVVGSASMAYSDSTEFLFRMYASDCGAGENQERQFNGFKVAGVDGILTALHGITGCKHYSAFRNEESWEVEPTHFNLSADLVVLTSDAFQKDFDIAVGLERSAANEEQDLEIPAYPPDARKPFHTPVRTEKRPQLYTSWGQTDYAAQISSRGGSPSISMKMLSFSGRTVKGHSGAPLLDLEGRVVGLLQGGLSEAEHGFAIEISEIDGLTNFSTNEFLAIQDTGISLFAIAKDDWATDLLIKQGVIRSSASLVSEARAGRNEIVMALLATDLSPDSRPANDVVPLVAAISSDHLTVARMLVQYGASLEASAGGDPIEAAANQRDLDMLKVVVGLDESIDYQDSGIVLLELAQRAFVASIISDFPSGVELLAKNYPELIMESLPNGSWPLAIAARNGASNSASLLVAIGAKGGAKEALNTAIVRDDLAVALALRDFWDGIDGECDLVGSVIRSGAQRILAAAMEGADINKPACGNDTPLFVAMKMGADEFVEIILGASPFIRNPMTGDIPKNPTLEMIRTDSRNRQRLGKMIRERAAVRSINYALDGLLKQRIYISGDLLTDAAFALRPELLESLLPRVNDRIRFCREVKGQRPLHAAIEGYIASDRSPTSFNSAKEIIEILTSEFSDHSSKDCNDVYAEQLATPAPEMLAVLLENSNLRSDQRKIMLTQTLAAAAYNGDLQSVNLLIERGAHVCGDIKFLLPERSRFVVSTSLDVPIHIALAASQQEAFSLLWEEYLKKISWEIATQRSFECNDAYEGLVDIAACASDLEMLRVILSNPPEGVDFNNSTLHKPYFCSAWRNEIQVIAALNDVGLAASGSVFLELEKKDHIEARTVEELCKGWASRSINADWYLESCDG